MTLVSTVVATYKRDSDLKRALESLAKQTYTDMEIILVDDNGNTEWNEKVSAIVSDFKEKFPAIQFEYIVNNPNRGSAEARNIGIATARGEYITFLDDDDIYLPDKVRRQVEFMKEGGYDYSFTDLVLYNEDEKEIDRRVRSYITDTSTDSLRVYHLKYHMTGTDTMMFRKEYLSKISGFAPIDMGDEYYLMQRAIEGEGKFGYLPGCDVKAYIHTGENSGISSGEGKINGENALFEYKKTFFKDLPPSAIRYIKMRHYAVLAFAEMRRGNYGAFLKNGIHSFFAAPIACISLLVRGQ